MPVNTMPGPVGLPTETVTPDVSECSRIPVSRRPVSSAASAWPPSWAIVTTFLDSRQAWYGATTANANTPVATTNHSFGSGWVPVRRSHISVRLESCTSGLGVADRESVASHGAQIVLPEGDVHPTFARL